MNDLPTPEECLRKAEETRARGRIAGPMWRPVYEQFAKNWELFAELVAPYQGTVTLTIPKHRLFAAVDRLLAKVRA